MKPSLIVHGGAWDIPDEAVDACNYGTRRALEAGWSILHSGGSALDAVEAAILVLEDEPVFDAGFGSHLNLDGRVECDAIVMNGANLRAGAVAGLQRVHNPIRAARAVLEHSPHMMLIAEGAERFARDHGIVLCDPTDLVSDAERIAWQLCREDTHAAEHHRGHEQGTVGAVALDARGQLFAGTSTGGTCCKLPGRVGDSPLIGCGCYADSAAGGVSCTGYGEAIMKIVMAKAACDLLALPPLSEHAHPVPEHNSHSNVHSEKSGPPSPTPAGENFHAMLAARKAVHLLAQRTHATGGLILLDRDGNPGFAFNTPRMAYAYVSPDGSFFASV
ncbi:MAG TPA: isoaspartyl peptidase/L-asparaginase [Candidatus Methylomirabilis sp.]|nr:isoaspartyl peptidase/L-asparaginase [Candidatus Methylomirabilis sp.]